MDSPTREQATATLRDGHEALEALFARLNDEQTARPATIGGGDWSARDLLGHIAFWEELAQRTIDDFRAERRPFVEQLGDGPEAVDRANADNQARTAAQSVAETRARAATAHGALVQAIDSLSDDEWGARFRHPGAGQATLADLLGEVLGAPQRPFGHAQEHLPDLQAYCDSLAT